MNFYKFGKFSKGNSSAVSLNFSDSSNPLTNCDKRCKLFGTICYAFKLEKFKPNIKRSGENRFFHPVQILNSAILQLRMARNLWVRCSVFGSLPKVSAARKIKGFESAFLSFVKALVESGSKLHLPLESYSKFVFYQKMIESVSSELTARETVQTVQTLKRRPIDHQCAFVVGSFDIPLKTRISKAQTLASELRLQGKKTVVCPAIKTRKQRKAKCGDCTACSDKRVSVVLYPLHG